MNSVLSFEPVFSTVTILMLTVPAFAFFMWREFVRAHKWRVLRLAALMIALTSLLGVMLRPYRVSQENLIESILLTANFDKVKVDSLIEVNPKLKVIRTGGAEHYGSAKELSSYNQLPSENINYIFGDGLPSYAVNSIVNEFEFFPSKTPDGIIELHLPDEIYASKRNLIRGVLNTSVKTTLKLAGPAGIEDSVTLLKGIQSFVLSVKPKQVGLFVYNLEWQNENGTKMSEKLPVEVKTEERLKILIAQKFPSAEMKHLKNYLAENGHAVAVRSQTSKTNFNSEFVNIARRDLSRLTSELLGDFDLVILDSRSTWELSEAEKSAFKKAVYNGLGVVLTEVEIKTNGFFQFKGATTATDTANVQLASKSYTLAAQQINIAQQAIIPVLKNNTRILEGYRLVGAGKIGFQLLQETYKIALEGKADDYAAIWSPLLEKMSRKGNEKSKLVIKSPFPYLADEPLEFSAISNSDHPVVTLNKIRIPLLEDVLIDDYWSGRAWPDEPGWHQLVANDSVTNNFYVSLPDEWKSLRVTNQIRATKLSQNHKEIRNLKPQLTRKEIPLLIFFMAFLLAFGFLWLAPKI